MEASSPVHSLEGQDWLSCTHVLVPTLPSACHPWYHCVVAGGVGGGRAISGQSSDVNTASGSRYRCRTFSQSSLVAWATDVHPDPGCMGTIDPDMALGHRRGPHSTTVWVAEQGSHITVFLTSRCSSLPSSSISLHGAHSFPSLHNIFCLFLALASLHHVLARFLPLCLAQRGQSTACGVLARVIASSKQLVLDFYPLQTPDSLRTIQDRAVIIFLSPLSLYIIVYYVNFKKGKQS